MAGHASSRHPVPARAGIGLRAPHHDALLDERPAVGWLEVHSENYFADGGAQLEHLDRARERYPVSLHGVGLSLGSTDPLDGEHLRRLARLVRRVEPVLVSEHVSWGSVDGRHFNDLLPMPYTEEALAHLAGRVRAVQDRLGTRILVENVSSYLRFRGETLAEWDFLAALAEQADCGILLDLNNVYVNARNHGFDARAYLRAMPAARVAEFHLAGHTVKRHGATEILVDTHSTHVCAAVWRLFEDAVDLLGPRPTLIEWDAELPSLATLAAEAAAAERLMNDRHEHAA